MKTKIRLSLAAIVLLQLVALPAHAVFINNATGLATPGFVQNFDGSGLAQNTVITNQFAGVTLSPFLRLQPTSQCGGCTGFANDFVANFFPQSGPNDFTLSFGTMVSEAAFAITDQNQTWTFQALLGGAVVESASLVIPFAPGVGFVGFTDILFDSIRVFTAGSTTAMGLDTLQYTVPEPSTLALFGLALVGLGFSRRRTARR